MMKARARSGKPSPPPIGVGDKNISAMNDLLSDSRALFLIIASTVLVYANSLSGAFVFDDTKQIAGNPALRSWSNIARAFTSDVWAFQRGTLTKDIPPPYYRPLFTAYLTINYHLFGLWEPGWHLMNLLVHTGATVAIYFLLKRLSGDRVIAPIAALIFGLHPAHVESVSWISGIPDPLAALFYAPSLIWYVRYRTDGEKKFLVGSVIAYGLSALCKETPLALRLHRLGIRENPTEAQFQYPDARDDPAAYSLRFDGRRLSFAAVLRARPPQLEASIHGPGP